MATLEFTVDPVRGGPSMADASESTVQRYDESAAPREALETEVVVRSGTPEFSVETEDTDSESAATTVPTATQIETTNTTTTDHGRGPGEEADSEPEEQPGVDAGGALLALFGDALLARRRRQRSRGRSSFFSLMDQLRSRNRFAAHSSDYGRSPERNVRTSTFQ